MVARDSSQPLRILLVVNDDEQAGSIRGVLAASTSPRFHVEQVSSGWDAQRHAAAGVYTAVVVEDTLCDVDGETLLGRLKAMGVGAPALVLSSASWDQVVGGGDDYLAKREGLTGSTLVRTIVALVERRELTEQVAAAGAQAERASKILADLTHDLATPLGVVMGMTQVLLTDDNGLNDDGRSCLEDVAREALRASEILKGCNSVGLAASTSPVPVVQEPSVRRAIPPGVGSKMVLIADDDPATRRLVCATLASDRYSVVEAADGKEAWRLIREHNPAVAILDWQMPVYSGLELTDVIKGDPLIRDMTVIMLTGRSGPADRAAGERAHADLYLVKPFSPYELLRAVEQALSVN